jgi:hypothetical protein
MNCIHHRRLADRRGKKKAVIAVAHSILISAYHRIKNKEPYVDLGSSFTEKRVALATTRRMVRRLETMGYKPKDGTLNALMVSGSGVC